MWLIWALALFLLIFSGVSYRVVASNPVYKGTAPISLPVPLSAFPTEIGNWTGQDVPIPDNIQRVARNDDFLNRLYVNKTTNEWVNLYIAFSARPRTMLGHRPQVCYPAGGWVHDGTSSLEVASATGRVIPCLTHRFHRPSAQREERVVLNYYVLNGRLTSNDRGFSGISWRTPNIGGRLARYVAQVQISSVVENSVRKAAQDMTELIVDFLPDEDGNIRAATYIGTDASADE